MPQHSNQLKSRTVFSLLSLFFQSGYSAFLGLIANLVLTILLSPAIFGIYIIVLSIISLLNYFSDIGLAASLIQKKEISDDDIKTTFTVQQLLIISLVIIGFTAGSFIRKFYSLPQDGLILYWALLVSFFISSLKTIPSVLLERRIHFQKIVLVQVVENTVFYLTVVITAILGFGLKSFAFGVLIRSVTGLILIYSISFWIPKIGISLKSLKNLLSFGAPFQASSFLALFKDDLITLFLGKVLGFTGLGYIGWAKKWAEAPIRIIMDNISRVLFPVISRVQEDKQKIKNIVEKFLYYQTLLLAPIMLGLVLMMERLIFLIPRYNKWLPALPLFYLFCFSAFFSSFSTPFINLFNALGKVKISLSFMLFWTIVTWILTPVFTKTFGLMGFPLTQMLLSLTFVIVVIKAKQYINFNFFKPVSKSILSAILMGIIVVISNFVLNNSPLSLVFSVFIGLITYFITLKYLFKIDLITEVKSIFLK